MYNQINLKPTIKVTDTTVECPVKDCGESVVRQRKDFKREEQFKCPIHDIYISPSTFEYETEYDNLLWTNSRDRVLLEQIKSVKRESRIARDNSEDAVSWNVFRYLEHNSLIEELLTVFSGHKQHTADIIYWSYSQKERNTWSMLDKAREVFGEHLNRGSEPDIIILTDETLFFLEAKVLAGNNTSPSDPRDPKKYITGGNNWFSEVFKSNYSTIAIDDKKYELLRFWLLGSWMASELGINFNLISLVLSVNDLKLEEEFGRHIMQNSQNRFYRKTWEYIYELIINENRSDMESRKMIEYFKTKTLGYSGTHILRKAFTIQ